MPHDDWQISLKHPNLAYPHFDYHFRFLPPDIQKHREYFEEQQRGFGDRAFHTVWHCLFRRYPIWRFLEIGVYREQILSLVALLQKLSGMEQSVTGISPLSEEGDSVSCQYTRINHGEDILENFRRFHLGAPRLVKARSTAPLSEQVVRAGQ